MQPPGCRGSSLRISVTRSELLEAELTTPDNQRTTILLESNADNRLLNSLPVDRHMPYILVHSALSEMNLDTLQGMHSQLGLSSALSATVIPHDSQTDPLGGPAPLSSVFMDAFRGLGNAKISINGVDIPPEAQEILRNGLGLRSTGSEPASYVVENGLSPRYAEMVAQNCSGTDAQKAQLVDFLCQPGAAAALCSAFYQSFNVPALMLTHTRVDQANQNNAGNPLPNACLNISLSQTPGCDIHVASHTGVRIMAPADRPDVMGMLTNRTTYTVSPNLKCKIDEMVKEIKPQYS
ncbi:secretion protein EspG, partial [Escherichia coli]|nr:secretion protein EspG [Escherichia coli]EHI1042730.1 secretion protein EspG [Escherichia coli]